MIRRADLYEPTWKSAALRTRLELELVDDYIARLGQSCSLRELRLHLETKIIRFEEQDNDNY